MKKQLITLLLAALILSLSAVALQVTYDPEPAFFVGVEIAYGGLEDLKLLVDRVKSFTNLFVIGLPNASLGLSFNKTQLTEAADYICEAGLHFIVQYTSPILYMRHSYDPNEWITYAMKRYGGKFLGVYYFDEPGGRQLDGDDSRFVIEAENYTEASKTYVEYVYAHIYHYLSTGVRLFTADYGLYWFDYRGGYDAVLAEFGWNHSRPLHVALCRGAAKTQGKEWGVMITWDYMQPPYIQSPERLYEDLMLAYHAGAKYAVIFNYPKLYDYGVLTEQHLETLAKFWKYVQENPDKHGCMDAELAIVLPGDYGLGLRSPEDNIWGLFEATSSSREVYLWVNAMSEKYGLKLDIIYCEPPYIHRARILYKQLVYWWGF